MGELCSFNRLNVPLFYCFIGMKNAEDIEKIIIPDTTYGMKLLRWGRIIFVVCSDLPPRAIIPAWRYNKQLEELFVTADTGALLR